MVQGLYHRPERVSIKYKSLLKLRNIFNKKKNLPDNIIENNHKYIFIVNITKKINTFI